jgi:hypothetical protein
MSWFFYFQKVGGEDAWQVGLAETREHVIATEQPRFVTVLDLNAALEDGWTREQIDNVKYRGPLYFDFDGEDLEVVIDKARFLLGKLVEHDVDPRAIRIYATGGRGFHFEVPWEMFIAKPPKAGAPRLPAIYKEMAYELYVDTLDLRVYSARKGRMWRTPNVRRENGKFKVQITAEELMNISVADYHALCSQPRTPFAVGQATLSQKLAVLYAKAESKVDAASKKRKDSKKDFELLSKFKGQFPPSLAGVMAGTLASNQGFHQIALQITITSNALGKTEEQMIALCEGLIENHQSDSQRYNTPAKRREELKRLYAYTQGNPCYEYSRDAVRKLLPAGTSSPDLDGLTPEAAGEVTASGEAGNDEGLLGGVFVTEQGVFVRKEEGALKISDVSFRDVHMLCAAETGEPFGYEAETLMRGKPRGRRLIPLECFLSKQKYMLLCNGIGGPFTGTDNHVQSLLAILRDTAMKNDKVIYIVLREGLDLIQRPEASEKKLDFIWVSPREVVSADPDAPSYKHRGNPNPEGVFKSDLLEAPDFVANDKSAAVIEALTRFNEPYAVACLLGWFTSAFHRQIYHHLPDSQFPLLQIFGQSGAGKSSTVRALMRLYYYLSQPVILPADSSTLHSIRTAVQSSASIPVVLEEFKPRQFGVGKYSGLLQILRSAYNAQTFAKGGMAEGLNTNFKDIRMMGFAAPMAFIGEALEAETAVLERSISVPLSKGSLSGREKAHTLLGDQSAVLASLGKELVRATFAMDRDAFRERLDAHCGEANKIAFKRNNHRVVFNLGVVLNGLGFLQEVIQHHFQSQFDERFDALRIAALDISKHVAVTAMPEAAKVLNILAHISKTERLDSDCALKDGEDYLVNGDKLEINMRNCYWKYTAWLRRRGQAPLYDNEDAFMHGLRNYSPLVTHASVGAKLKDDRHRARLHVLDSAAQGRGRRGL